MSLAVPGLTLIEYEVDFSWARTASRSGCRGQR
jgi:hypothetical protein